MCVIWITMDEHNIFEHLKIRYKLVNMLFKLKCGRIVLKFSFILGLLKFVTPPCLQLKSTIWPKT